MSNEPQTPDERPEAVDGTGTAGESTTPTTPAAQPAGEAVAPPESSTPSAFPPPAPEHRAPDSPAAAPHSSTAPQGAAFGYAAQQPHPVATPYPQPQQYASQPSASGPSAPASTTERRRGLAVPVIAALAVGALLGGASGAGVSYWAATQSQGSVSSEDAEPQTVTVNDTDSVNATTAVAAKASPSVVTISVSSGSSGGTGSGVILSDDGYVLTNTHVVTLDGQAADGTIEVTGYDGKLYTAKLIGTDPTVDLAVIKLDDASGLTPISFGNSDKLNVGDIAIAIGAPLGLSNTVTDGIVSALNRSISIASSAAPTEGDQDQSDTGDSGSGDSPFDFWNLPGEGSSSTPTSTISIPVIQTDASINPGNSGGALVDKEGKLIGVNVAIASTGSTESSTSQSGSIGVGFAIPANLAKRISEEIIANGTATHGLLGASVKDATSETSDTVGALIAEVPGDGAAKSAGLEAGDVVTEFDGHPITGATDLTAQVRTLAGGATAKITYVRDGRAEEVEVTLGTLQAD